MLGTTETIIIVGIIVLIFGASAIPKLAKSVGRARSEFEKGVKEGKRISDSHESSQQEGKTGSKDEP